MNVLIMWLQLMPALIAASIKSVHELESGFESVAKATGNTVVGAGAHKLSVLETTLSSILGQVEGAAAAIPLAKVMSVTKTITGVVVSVFNKIGFFKSNSAPAAVAQGPAN